MCRRASLGDELGGSERRGVGRYRSRAAPVADLILCDTTAGSGRAAGPVRRHSCTRPATCSGGARGLTEAPHSLGTTWPTRRPSSRPQTREGHADRQPLGRSRSHDLGRAIANLRLRPAETPTLVPESGVKSLWYGLTAFVTRLPHLSRPGTSLLLMSGSFVHNPIIAGCKRFASPLPSGPSPRGRRCGQ
jgi:hypothetical protein